MMMIAGLVYLNNPVAETNTGRAWFESSPGHDSKSTLHSRVKRLFKAESFHKFHLDR